MKKSLFFSCLILAAMTVSAQKLTELYRQGTVRLIPDNGYAQGNDWNKVFRTYYDTIYGEWMGNQKSLKLLPDGSVMVNHRYRDYYTKFTPSGSFEKEFGIRKASGDLYKNINAVQGVLDNGVHFTGVDNAGNMLCFDGNGNYKKTLKLDYMVNQMTALPGNRIEVVGWTSWSTKFRDFVAIVDYETNKEQIIWDHFTDHPDFNAQEDRLFSYTHKFSNGSMATQYTMPYAVNNLTSARPVIARSGNYVFVCNPETGEIRTYDLNGKLLSTDKTEWAVNRISVEEQRLIQQKAIDTFRENLAYVNRGELPPSLARAVQSNGGPQQATVDMLLKMEKELYEDFIPRMEADLARIKDPIPLPYFSTVIPDSEGNLLIFEYPKEDNANRFNVWVYNNGGTFVCRSTFVCDDYELEINPSKMVFKDGYIYALQVLKNASGVPLRLVRFRLAN